MSSFSPPGDCPNCGEYVPAGALSCRECGSTADTGWSDEVAYDGLDLPDEAWDDSADKPKPKNVTLRLVAAAALLAIVFLLWALTKP